MEFFSCPHCGADVPTKAKFCRECGADESSGWGDLDDYEPGYDSDFDYEDFVRREFPEHADTESRGFPWVGLVVILLIISMLLMLF